MLVVNKTRQPIYLQLTEKIKNQILCGKYLPNTKLPSIHELSRENGVNPNTTQRGFDMLKREKLIEKHSTQGYIVTSDLQHISEVRQETIKSMISTFLQNMHQIGYSYNNNCALLKKSLQQNKMDSKYDMWPLG